MTGDPNAHPAPLQLAMVLFPGFTPLDLIGPQTTLAMNSVTHLVAATQDPVVGDSGVAVLPSCTFKEAPSDVDVLFAPGGFGTADAMEHEGLLRFIDDRARTARYVTSVCTGSLILGAAGALQGYRATTHWAFFEVLEALGIKVERRRVVVDGNRITGGGVTAGIDFGLRLLAEARGEDAAKLSQLGMEYDPDPPFSAGSPVQAGEALTAMASGPIKSWHPRMLQIAARARARQAGAAA